MINKRCDKRFRLRQVLAGNAHQGQLGSPCYFLVLRSQVRKNGKSNLEDLFISV